MEIAIIGGGAAGLCAARHASATYRCRPTVFEKSGRIGGVWVYNPKTGKDEKGERIVSSMYRDLKTNLPKEIMCYPDVPMKSSIKESFIHHSQVLEYLEEFTENFGLKKFIKFNTKVVNIQPTDPKETKENGEHGIAKENSGSICQDEKKKWKIEYLNSESNKTQIDYFDAVIVCTGAYADPYYPDIPGIETFQGKVIHSSDYRYASTFRDEDVVILGASFSGADIGLDLAKSASKIYLSHNKPKLKTPLPDNMHQISGIARCSGANTFTLVDGTSVEATCLLLATGFDYSFPFLSPDCGLSVKNREISPLYKHVINIQHPTMAILGILTHVLLFPQVDRQAQFFLKSLNDDLLLPSKEIMYEDTAQEKKRRTAKGMRPQDFHKLGEETFAYLRSLSEMGGFQPLNPYVEKIWTQNGDQRLLNLQEYKNKNYILLNHETYEFV